MQPKVKFLTAVWGERYIERFCALSLPSFLSPGNLPCLADNTDFEVVIMTREADTHHFERNPAFVKLCGICPVRFVPIDDLITTCVYGVTLTLAYARPIIACGEDMLNTHFVFMNADFVLADGSLRSLSHHIHAGRSIVLGPSYRAIAEEIEPVLEAMVNRHSAVLEVAPRDLVRLSLQHPHRTTVAKTMNQQVFSSTHPNQLFWQVDQNTVLGRYFLIFMLCLKPERVMRTVNCFCDYSFIPELCPSGDEVAMGDSDEFFMLELQSRTQETFMLRQGLLPYHKIAASLQEWATVEHRRAASHDIVFHSGDLPANLAEVRREADTAVQAIRRHLGSPKDYINHYYWVMGVEAWKDYRQRQGLSFNAPELAPYTLRPLERFLLAKHRLGRNLRRQARVVLASPTVRRWGRLLRRIERLVIHGPGRASTASAHWQTGQLLRTFGEELRSTEVATLVVGHPGSHRSLGALPLSARALQEPELSAIQPGCERYGQVVYFPATLRPESLEIYLYPLLNSLAPGGTLHIVAHVSARCDNYSRAVDMAFLLGEVVGNHLQSLSVRTTGGHILAFGDRLAKFASLQLLRYSRRRRVVMAPLLAPITLAGMALAHLANTFAFTGYGRRLTTKSYLTIASVEMAGLWSRRSPAEQALEAVPVAVDHLALEIPARKFA
jgi:hypothetical protein